MHAMGLETAHPYASDTLSYLGTVTSAADMFAELIL